MRRVQQAHLLAAAALAVSGLRTYAAFAQTLFTTEDDFAEWTLNGSPVIGSLFRIDGVSAYNGLATGAHDGPGAIGYPGDLEIAPPAGQDFAEAFSQNFANNADADAALSGADFIQVNVSGNADFLNIALIQSGVYSTGPEFPTSIVNEGTYWTFTYGDSVTNASPGSESNLQLGFNLEGTVPLDIFNIRIVSPAWNNPAGGDWNTSGNWTTSDTGMSPNFQGLEADFLGGINSNQTVSTSEAVNIGTILFNNSGASYTLAATGIGNITMNMPGVEPAAINDQGGTHFIAAPLILASNTDLTVANSGDVLHLSGAISGTGGLTVNGNGTVSLESANSYGGATSVNSGTLSATTAGALPATTSLTIGTSTTSAKVQLAASSGTQTVAALTINSGSVLDLANNRIIINYGAGPDPATTIRGYLINGYNGGKWTGASGISSSIAALSASSADYGLGYADGADGVVTGLSSGQIEVAYTLYGDANLDGSVDGDDFTILASNLGKQESAWDKGDFNYDGIVDGDDFTLLVQNLGKQSNGASVVLPASDYAALDAFAAAHGLIADVPEPTPVGLAVLTGMAALSVRRRSTSRR